MFKLNVDQLTDIIAAVEFEGTITHEDFEVDVLYSKIHQTEEGNWQYLTIWTDAGKDTGFGEGTKTTDNAGHIDNLAEHLREVEFSKARIFREWIADKEAYDEYDTYESLAKRLKIDELVVISSKVPKAVANKLARYAQRETITVSGQIRRLVLEWLEEQVKEDAKALIYQE